MLGLILAAAVAASVPAAPPVVSTLDAVVDDAARSGFAGEVLVSSGGKVVYARAVSAPGRPHRRGDLWRWASVTKQLTATLVLQQVGSGRLSLDDTVAARLPEFRGPTAGTVTIRMLLQHTSGLPNPDDTPAASDAALPGFYVRTSRDVGGRADALGYCAGKPKAQPGAGFAYNNCDYIVLGAVLERVTGRGFDALLRQDIAAPARLQSLRMAKSRGMPRTTRGFQADGSPEPVVNLATFGPAGAAYGPSDDLVRFDQALLDGRLLSPPQRDAAWKGDPHLGYVALGAWGFQAPLKGCPGTVDLVERRGGIGGVEVRNLLAPKLGKALVVFADRAELDFGEIWQGRGLTWRLASAAFC